MAAMQQNDFGSQSHPPLCWPTLKYLKPLTQSPKQGTFSLHLHMTCKLEQCRFYVTILQLHQVINYSNQLIVNVY